MTEGMNPPSEPVEESVPEPEAPAEEGQKYDGGDIPRSEPSEQEDEN